MEPLRALAARLDEASATLTDLARRVTATDPAHPAFGADAAGRPGEIGRALHRRWTAATDERAREAEAAAARLAAAAIAVREAAERYADTDAAARDRLTGPDPGPHHPPGADVTGFRPAGPAHRPAGVDVPGHRPAGVDAGGHRWLGAR